MQKRTGTITPAILMPSGAEGIEEVLRLFLFGRGGDEEISIFFVGTSLEPVITGVWRSRGRLGCSAHCAGADECCGTDARAYYVSGEDGARGRDLVELGRGEVADEGIDEYGGFARKGEAAATMASAPKMRRTRRRRMRIW
jgi:hypothetical protein